jgi:putative transcriptional regulator
LESAREVAAHRAGKKKLKVKYAYRMEISPADIKKMRTRLKLSQPAFAEHLFVSVAAVRGWEQGLRKPSGPARRLLSIARRNPRLVFA